MLQPAQAGTIYVAFPIINLYKPVFRLYMGYFMTLLSVSGNAAGYAIGAGHQQW